MKNALIKVVAFFALSFGAHAVQLDSAAAMSVFPANTLSATNPIAFTNSLALTNDVTTLQSSNLATLLLTLQTNMEETLSALSFITSNAAVIQVSSGGQNSGAPGTFVPGPASPFLPPLGAPNNGVETTALAVPVGTNILVLNQQTFQAVATLQNDLARALPVLQALNGTTVTTTNVNGTNITAVFTNRFPAITNSLNTGLRGVFTAPLTNQSVIQGPIVPIATPSAF